MGRHVGRENGGTQVYTCSRCGGSFWQEHDFSAVTREAEALMAIGEHENALRLAQRAVRDQYAMRVPWRRP